MLSGGKVNGIYHPLIEQVLNSILFIPRSYQMLKLNLGYRDPAHTNYLIRRGMFQDLNREQYLNDRPEVTQPREIIHRHYYEHIYKPKPRGEY